MATATAKPAKLSRGSYLTISVEGNALLSFRIKYAPFEPSKPMVRRPEARTCCPEHGVPVKMAYRCQNGELLEGEGVVEYRYPVGEDYVVVNKSMISVENDGVLNLIAFVDVGAIDPLYYEQPYLVEVADKSEVQHDLMAAILREAKGKMLVGTTMMNGATRMFTLRWSDKTQTLILHKCLYDERLNWGDAKLISDGIKQRDAKHTKKSIAEGVRYLGQLLPDSYDPSVITDEYRVALEKAIARAAKGEKPKAPAKKQPVAAPSVDLIAQLKQSVDEAKRKTPPTRKPSGNGRKKRVAEKAS